MNPELEFIPHNPSVNSFRCQHLEANHLQFNWHYHPYYELTWIQSGNGNRLIGKDNDHFSANDLVLLPPGLPHTWYTSPGTIGNHKIVATVIHFPKNLDKVWDAVTEFGLISKMLKASKSGIQFPSDQAEVVRDLLQNLPTSTGPKRFLMLTELLVILSESKWRPIYMHGRELTAPNEKVTSRIHIVHDYITQNYQQPLRLTEVARIAHLSPVSFSRFFSGIMGKSFTEYVIELRINHAASLLRNTDAPVAEIAFQVGFKTLSNFNRQFRAIHEKTPTEFRNNSIHLSH